MVLNRQKLRRYERLNADWRINDWSAKLGNKNNLNPVVPSPEFASSIIVKSNVDSIEMVKTKWFLDESINSSKGSEGTMIIDPSASNKVTELHAILLNIQPFGWIYIPGGRKNEKA